MPQFVLKVRWLTQGFILKSITALQWILYHRPEARLILHNPIIGISEPVYVPVITLMETIKQISETKFISIPHGIFFGGSHGGWEGGLESMHPYGRVLECLSPILLNTVTYTYFDTLNQRGQVSSFKTLEMRYAQNSAANLTNAKKVKILICGAGRQLFLRMTKK